MLDFFKAFLYYTNMKKLYDTLVLNRLYIPNHIVSWQRAVSLLYQGAAKSLDMDLIPYDWDSWIEYSRLPAEGKSRNLRGRRIFTRWRKACSFAKHSKSF